MHQIELRDKNRLCKRAFRTFSFPHHIEAALVAFQAAPHFKGFSVYAQAPPAEKHWASLGMIIDSGPVRMHIYFNRKVKTCISEPRIFEVRLNRFLYFSYFITIKAD